MTQTHVVSGLIQKTKWTGILIIASIVETKIPLQRIIIMLLMKRKAGFIGSISHVSSEKGDVWGTNLCNVWVSEIVIELREHFSKGTFCLVLRVAYIQSLLIHSNFVIFQLQVVKNVGDGGTLYTPIHSIQLIHPIHKIH